MKILVIGSGGREHAIVDALAKSPKTSKIFAAPGNGGMREHAELVSITVDDIAGLASFARNQRIDLTFVGPEAPLSQGVIDLFRQYDLAAVGPAANQARLESSKSFAKTFFKANKIPAAGGVEGLGDALADAGAGPRDDDASAGSAALPKRAGAAWSLSGLLDGRPARVAVRTMISLG